MAQQNSRKLAGLGAAIVALSIPAALPASAATGGLDIDAQILASPLAISGTQNMNFGAFTGSALGGTVLITPAGGSVYTGVTQVPQITPTQALASVYGNSGVNIIVSITNPVVTVTNGTATMQVSQFNIATAAGGATETLNMTSTIMQIPVGATLNVGATQPVGAYTGTFTVNAIYQ